MASLVRITFSGCSSSICFLRPLRAVDAEWPRQGPPWFWGFTWGAFYKAGGLVGSESSVAPLGSLEGLNMVIRRKPDGTRSVIGRSEQVYSEILDGSVDARDLRFP
eukprot:332324-Pyramimonas_sp.AAC.1